CLNNVGDSSAFRAAAKAFGVGRGFKSLWAHHFGACHRFSINCPAPRFVRAKLEMKAKIIITPKKAVLDPQGKTVQNALAHMGYSGVGSVHVGKYLEIELTEANLERARAQVDEACHKILSNPVMGGYRFEIE